MRRGRGTRSSRQHGVPTQRGAGSVMIPQEAVIAALRTGRSSARCGARGDPRPGIPLKVFIAGDS